MSTVLFSDSMGVFISIKKPYFMRKETDQYSGGTTFEIHHVPVVGKVVNYSIFIEQVNKSQGDSHIV